MADDEGGSSFKSESGRLLMVTGQYRVNLFFDWPQGRAAHNSRRFRPEPVSFEHSPRSASPSRRSEPRGLAHICSKYGRESKPSGIDRDVAEDRPVLEDQPNVSIVLDDLLQHRVYLFAIRAPVVEILDDGDVAFGVAFDRYAWIAQNALATQRVFIG